MSDQWDFYLCLVEDAPTSMFVDLGARDAAPDGHRPYLLWVWVTMRHPRNDGLSSSDEAPSLHAIEDTLVPAIETAMEGQFVGRVTGASRREFYFYGAEVEGFSDVVRQALSAFPRYRHESGHQEDSEWRQYFEFLYPPRRQLEQIRNRGVVEALEREGDPLNVTRPVTHWAYFADEESRRAAAVRLLELGFEVGDSDEASGERPFGLQFEKSSSVDQASVDAASMQILDVLEGLDAEYDGWEAPIVRGSAQEA